MTRKEEGRMHNSSYPKGGVSYSKDSFLINQTLVFQIKFCGKRPALWVAAKRYRAFKIDNSLIEFKKYYKQFLQFDLSSKMPFLTLFKIKTTGKDFHKNTSFKY